MSTTAAINTLRARGMRVSAARRRLLEALYATGRPATAAELADGLDLASTYRNLDALQAAGLVRHLHAGHGPGLFAATGAGEREYAVCEDCGTTRAFAPGELDDVRAAVAEACGFSVGFDHFPLVGRCPRCD